MACVAHHRRAPHVHRIAEAEGGEVLDQTVDLLFFQRRAREVHALQPRQQADQLPQLVRGKAPDRQAFGVAVHLAVRRGHAPGDVQRRIGPRRGGKGGPVAAEARIYCFQLREVAQPSDLVRRQRAERDLLGKAVVARPSDGDAPADHGRGQRSGRRVVFLAFQFCRAHVDQLRAAIAPRPDPHGQQQPGRRGGKGQHQRESKQQACSSCPLFLCSFHDSRPRFLYKKPFF